MAREYPNRDLMYLIQLLAGGAGATIGTAVGVAVAVPLRRDAASKATDALREEGAHVCGLSVVGPIFEGTVLGAAVGGPVGLVAALLLGWLGNRWWATSRTGRCT